VSIEIAGSVVRRGAAAAADRLEPAEDLLDPLAHALTDSISRPADGAQVEGRTTWPPLILRHVRRDVERPAARNELGSIVTLVGRNGDPVKPPPLQHLQPLLAFGPPVDCPTRKSTMIPLRFSISTLSV
jgi:hypothetical protein